MLGFVLVILDPMLGAVIAFGIILGCICKALSLLHDINEKVSKISLKMENNQEANGEGFEEEGG